MLGPSLFGKLMLWWSPMVRFRGCHRHPMLFLGKSEGYDFDSDSALQVIFDVVLLGKIVTSHYQQKVRYGYIMYVPCNSIKAICTRTDSIGVSCDIAGDSLSTRTHVNYEKQDRTRLSNIITGYYLHPGLSWVPCLVLHLRADNRSWRTMQSFFLRYVHLTIIIYKIIHYILVAF